MKKIFLLFILFSTTLIAMAQHSGNSLGDLIKTEHKGQKFNFLTNNGTAEVTIYSSNILKLSIWKGRHIKNHSYAVIIKPEKVNYNIKENNSTYWIKTDSMILEINKKPLRFTFKNKNGHIINQDDPIGTYWQSGQISSFKKLFSDEKFLGLGEKTGPLNRRGNAYTNWNTDNPHYENWSDPLYSSIPFYIGVHDKLSYGIFVDNTSKSKFNFGAGNNRFSYFTVNDNQLDYYFIYGSSLSNIIKNYTYLTGRMKMPPVWSLGFQQSRWSYTPDKEVLGIAQNFRNKHIPLDVIYLDIAYMDDYKVFTWNKETFPHPAKMISKLKKMGIHTAVIIDPGVKIQKGYAIYDEGIKQNIFIKYPDGTDYSGEVWPGWCNFPDFTLQKARVWWGKQFSKLVSEGVTGFWNDMNEIAVWGKEVPEIVQMNYDGHPVSYLKGKNIYGMQMARSTFEGVKKLMDGQRPLVLTRSGYAGLQRYTAIWTGDNQATDDNMLLGIRLVNSFGLSGVAFSGYDTGGFGGNATQDLFARWISIASFSPFFRVHSAINTMRSEPWSYGEYVQKLAKKAINLRYHLLPYIYSSFYESSENGMPVQRSLSIDYTYDENIYKEPFENQYLFGPSIMVIPVKSTQQSTEVYFPKGIWYSFYTDKKVKGKQTKLVEAPLNKLPVFIKEGAIIPIQKLVQNTEENQGDTLELHLYNGNKGSYTYYEDDGVSYEYLKNKYYKRQITYKGIKNQLILSKPEGEINSKYKFIRIIFHGFNSGLKDIMLNNKPIKKDSAISTFYLSNYIKPIQNLFSLTLPNSTSSITITWKKN